jgi:hypothetical protein
MYSITEFETCVVHIKNGEMKSSERFQLGFWLRKIDHVSDLNVTAAPDHYTTSGIDSIF